MTAFKPRLKSDHEKTVNPEKAPKIDPWESDPSQIRRFLELRPEYERLCQEVAYSIRKSIDKAGVKIADISFRAKELDSFLEKIERKDYKGDPLVEITDFAGARIVCYYIEDIPVVSEIIESAFEVIDKQDKTEQAGVDRFGYGGIHYLVRLGSDYAGARYDDLKSLSCEIQLRTVMQHAWAIVSHHLVYKREDEMPTQLKRSVNALAGALDSADIAFQAVRAKKESYVASISEPIESSNLISVELNIDSLAKFIEFDLKEYDKEFDDVYLGQILERLRTVGITTLEEVDNLLKQTQMARDKLPEIFPRATKRNALSEIGRALLLSHFDELSNLLTHEDWAEAYRQVRHLVTKP